MVISNLVSSPLTLGTVAWYLSSNILLENTAYNSTNNMWSMIDFGFATKRKYGLDGFIGTIPYTSPHYSVQYIKSRNGNVDTDIVGDLFSFAITALTMLGYYFDIEPPNVYLDVTPLLHLYNRNIGVLAKSLIPKGLTFDTETLEIIHLLAGMVLTQIDTYFDTIVWSKRKQKCVFVGHNKMKFTMHSTSIIYYWDKLYTKIKKI